MRWLESVRRVLGGQQVESAFVENLAIAYKNFVLSVLLDLDLLEQLLQRARHQSAVVVGARAACLRVRFPTSCLAVAENATVVALHEVREHGLNQGVVQLLLSRLRAVDLVEFEVVRVLVALVLLRSDEVLLFHVLHELQYLVVVVDVVVLALLRVVRHRRVRAGRPDAHLDLDGVGHFQWECLVTRLSFD